MSVLRALVVVGLTALSLAVLAPLYIDSFIDVYVWGLPPWLVGVCAALVVPYFGFLGPLTRSTTWMTVSAACVAALPYTACLARKIGGRGFDPPRVLLEASLTGLVFVLAFLCSRSWRGGSTQ